VDVPACAAYAIAISSILQALLFLAGLDRLIFGPLLPLSRPPFAGKFHLLAES
jgi:hypothetical protein